MKLDRQDLFPLLVPYRRGRGWKRPLPQPSTLPPPWQAVWDLFLRSAGKKPKANDHLWAVEAPVSFYAEVWIPHLIQYDEEETVGSREWLRTKCVCCGTITQLINVLPIEFSLGLHPLQVGSEERHARADRLHVTCSLSRLSCGVFVAPYDSFELSIETRTLFSVARQLYCSAPTPLQQQLTLWPLVLGDTGV